MSEKRIMIAATKSGSGKTTITCSLLYRLKEMGLKVRAYKCGPDYIDPMFHKSVLGIESKNLDLFFANEQLVRELFLIDNDSDISVVEGVMGLYDGIGGVSEEASSYHLAKTLKIPIVLVVDAHGMGRSLIAEIAGFKSMDSENLIRGVILNRTSKSLYDSITPEIEKATGVKMLGYVSRKEEMFFDSRHLGLVLPSEIDNINEKLKNCAAGTLEGVSVQSILEIASEAEAFNNSMTASTATGKNENSVRIGIAMDEAFCFYYDDNLRLLKSEGIELVSFSPLHDEHLPADINGLIFGGGYPELYAKELSENTSMLNDIRNAMHSKIPSLAECGGFMYLHKAIITEDKREYPMVGALDGVCDYKGHLVRFGYISLQGNENRNQESMKDIFPIRGHEFHYFDSTINGNDCMAKKPYGRREWECAILGDNYLWGFAHLYYYSNPNFVKWFARKCFEYGTKQSV